MRSFYVKVFLLWLLLPLGMVTAYLLAQQEVSRGLEVADLGREARWWGEPRAQFLANEKLGAAFEVLKPLHKPVPVPKTGDWLNMHRESGQSFQAYRGMQPNRPTAERRILYVQRIGSFTKDQERVVDATIAYLGQYFGVAVKELPGMAADAIPERARRRHPEWGMRQILTDYVLDEVLAPNRPKDAVAVIALTSEDLWPGDGWNFVFGQAALYERVGVWSIFRNGDPSESEAAFRTVLRRTVKTAAHETGHMFSVKHCMAFHCIMNGSNHREESDRAPLHLCPSCLQKLSWNLGFQPVDRFEGLRAYYLKHGFAAEASYVETCLALWREKGFVEAP